MMVPGDNCAYLSVAGGRMCTQSDSGWMVRAIRAGITAMGRWCPLFLIGTDSVTGMSFQRWVITSWGPAEAIAANFAIWWGLWLMSPGWSSFGTSSTFSVMAMVASETVWGLLPTVAGVLLGWASLRGRSRVKRVVLLFLVAYFVFVTFIFALANFGSTAPVTYLHVALMYAWLWWTEVRRDG